MKNLIIFLVVIVGLAFVSYRFISIKPINNTRQDNTTSSATDSLQTPTGWTQLQSAQAQLKLEKSVESGVKPQIVLQTSENKDKADFKTYTNRLVAGARSAISSMRYEDDKFVEGAIQQRVLSGYYYNQKNKILLSQRLYQKDNTIYTLTASYGDPILKSEVESIFDSIAAKYITN